MSYPFFQFYDKGNKRMYMSQEYFARRPKPEVGRPKKEDKYTLFIMILEAEGSFSHKWQ